MQFRSLTQLGSGAQVPFWQLWFAGQVFGPPIVQAMAAKQWPWPLPAFMQCSFIIALHIESSVQAASVQRFIGSQLRPRGQVLSLKQRLVHSPVVVLQE
jgi:hypothetical protein